MCVKCQLKFYIFAFVILQSRCNYREPGNITATIVKKSQEPSNLVKKNLILFANRNIAELKIK